MIIGLFLDLRAESVISLERLFFATIRLVVLFFIVATITVVLMLIIVVIFCFVLILIERYLMGELFGFIRLIGIIIFVVLIVDFVEIIVGIVVMSA